MNFLPNWTLLPILTLLQNCGRFPKNIARGAASQQRALTPPDTWFCPTLGLACVLMSRPISPELVLSPDFCISNTPRYFSFAAYPEPVMSTDLLSFGHPSVLLYCFRFSLVAKKFQYLYFHSNHDLTNVTMYHHTLIIDGKFCGKFNKNPSTSVCHCLHDS